MNSLVTPFQLLVRCLFKWRAKLFYLLFAVKLIQRGHLFKEGVYSWKCGLCSQSMIQITQIIGGIAYSSIQYGSGSGPIYLTDVLCTGSETSLLRCNSDPIHSSGCTHSEDAGVKCEGIQVLVSIFIFMIVTSFSFAAPCTDGQLRLAGGNVYNEGRVEICLNNEWGTICDDSWNTNDANVACSILGFAQSGNQLHTFVLHWWFY